MSDYESELEYCTNEDVLNALPPPARKGNNIDSEVLIWKPQGQAYIDVLLGDKYIVPLQGVSIVLDIDNIPKAIRYASAMITASFILVNAYTENNYQTQVGDKVITLSQQKESQCKKLMKNFMDSNANYDLRLKEQLGTSTLAKVIKSFSNNANDNVTCFINEVNSFYT